MRSWLLFALAVAALQGATIRGTVVENQTGHPLARALVVLETLPGTSGQSRSVRTDLYGVFQFPPVSAGTYIVTASRTGFSPTQYGQKTWKSAGSPVVVAQDDSTRLAIRLPRLGVITGTVFDENDVGLPDYDVVAYRNTRPPQLAARGKSDERGVFRLSGLAPGSYLVRAAGKQYEEGGYIPTFGKETQIVDQAYPVEVDFDQQVDRQDVRPTPGRLFTLSVGVTTVPPNMPVTMTLVSDTGRETVQASGHNFGPLPPGQYELFSEAPLDGKPGIQGEYRKITLSQDTNIGFVLRQVPELQFTFAGGPQQVAVLARRKDLAGESASEVLKLAGGRVQLTPGPWELGIPYSSGYYVSGFSGPLFQAPGGARVDGWNEIQVGAGFGVRFALSPASASIHGTVRSAGDPVAGAPVFLEPLDLEPRKRVTNVFTARTDRNGQYRFNNLAPGNYRVLSSFEYKMPDAAAMTFAGAKPVAVQESRDAQQDLDLFVIR